MSNQNSFVVIPTFNESKNIERLVTEIFGLAFPNLVVVVVDDNSPDGTSQLVQKLTEKFQNLFLLQRIGVRGRGSAGIDGIEFAMQKDASKIIEMDADFSHPPAVIPDLFRALDSVDIAIASRLVSNAKDTRSLSRRVITAFANFYTRSFLEKKWHKSTVRDWTTGFRAYRRAVFEKVAPKSLVSPGPSILQEVLLRALNSGCTATEIPFEMVDRKEGDSTFNRKIALQSLLTIPFYSLVFSKTKSTKRVERRESTSHYVIENSPK